MNVEQPEGRAVEWMREQAQKMRMADVDSATVEELGSYLSAYLRNTVDTSQAEALSGLFEQALDHIASSPNYTVEGAMRVFSSPRQAEGREAVAWMRAQAKALGMENAESEPPIYLARFLAPFIAPPAKVPEGYVLVPVEPTREMVEAGILFGTSPNKACIIYQSMLAAAQQPKEDA